jgi:hypothetical protein
MPLIRKPHVEEILIDGKNHMWEVIGFDEKFPDLCLIVEPGKRPPSNPLDSSFIWKFSDGSLNMYFSHKE